MPVLVAGVNDLLTRNLELAKQLHPTKNGALIGSDISEYSNKKVWWLGECGHEWEATPSKRSSGRNCPYCTSRSVLAGFNDFASQRPDMVGEFHPTRNEKQPHEIAVYSNKKVWWLGACGHEWEATVQKRTHLNRGCPYCAGQKVLVGFNDLSTTYPNLAKEWSAKNDLSPSDVTAGTKRKFWWVGDCGHEWYVSVEGRSNGAGCPVCCNKLVLKGINDFGTIHPHLLREWDYARNDISPFILSAGSSKKVWWIGSCKHNWKTSVFHRKNGKGCPACAGRQVQVGFNDLATLDPIAALELHPLKNDGLLATEITAGTHRKVWWLCSCGHEWITSVRHRSIGKTGCPKCATSKTEKKFIEAFSIASGHDFIMDKIAGKRKMKVKDYIQIDGLNEALKVVIEYDGYYYHGPENPERKTYAIKLAEDADTTETLLNAGYKVVRIREQVRKKSLKFIEVNLSHLRSPELVDNLHQIHHDVLSKSKDSIEDTVRKVIEARNTWFE